MISRTTLILAVLVAGCDRQETKPEPEPEEAPFIAATASPLPAPAATAGSEGASATTAARADRQGPDALLRSYAGALATRDWTAAARAWARGSGVTAATLKAAYDRAEPPVLAVGQGVEQGAAGSVYYEAPVTLRFGEEPPERGSLVLRRVNDVQGSTPEQRRWHIERSTIGQGQ